MANNATQKTGRTFRGKMNDLEYYDMLPRSTRLALANALFDWSAGAIYNGWKKRKTGYKTGLACAKLVREWDRWQLDHEKEKGK